MHNVVKEKTTVNLMKALSSMYEKLSANNKVYLMKKLFNLKKVEGTPVVQHLNEFNTITNQLSMVGIEFDNEVRALILLASLPNSWKAMRIVLSNSAGKNKFKYDDIRDLILSEEVCRRDVNIDNSQDQAFVMENKSRGRSRGPNDRKFNGRLQSRDRSQFKETRECFHCGKNCRLRRDFWHWNKEHNKGKYEMNDSEKNATAAMIDEDVVVLSIEEQKCEHVANNDVEWVVDSSTPHHIIPKKGLFTIYKARDFGTVKMDNSSYSKWELVMCALKPMFITYDVEGCVTCFKFKDECVFYIGYKSSGLL